MSIQLRVFILVMLACVAPVWCAGTPTGKVVRVNPDRTFDARFTDGLPAVGDVYTLVRDGESVGEVLVRAVTASGVTGAPSEGLLGAPKLGDELTFARAAGPAPKPSEWLGWSAPDAGFAINAPHDHTHNTRVERRGPFTLNETTEIFTDTAHYVVFMVIWFDLPNGYLESDQASKPSDSVREELKKRDFRVAGSRTISFNGMEGLEFDVTLTDLWGRGRIFVTDKRLYQLFVFSAYHEVPKRPAQRFFESFRLFSSAGRPLKAPPAQASNSEDLTAY